MRTDPLGCRVFSASASNLVPVLSLILNWVGVTVMVAVGLGYAASVGRRSPSAVGDTALCAELGRLCSRRTRRLAASVVDLRDHPSARSAFEVTLETEVGEVIAEAHGTPLGGVTLRQLCTHTSGLPRLALTPTMLSRLLPYGVFGYDPYRGTSTATLLSTAARRRLRAVGRYRYSNLGAAVLGQVLARAAGHDFAEMLAERVLGPCDMRQCGVSAADRRARWGWSPLGQPRMPWVMGGYAPAGGVFATLADLTALAEGLLRGERWS